MFSSSHCRHTARLTDGPHRIWGNGSSGNAKDTARHNAFTDLIKYNDEWICAFREANDHRSDDSAIRMLKSTDGARWDPWGEVLRLASHDVRDPKLSGMPDGRLMLTAIGRETGAEYFNCKRRTHVAFWSGGSWTELKRISVDGTEDHLWTIWSHAWDWKDSTAYGLGLRFSKEPDEERNITLFSTSDGVAWKAVTQDVFTEEGRCDEASIAFEDRDNLRCVLRRTRETAWLGMGKPPFAKEDWKWWDTGLILGGPKFAILAGSTVLVGARCAVRNQKEGDQKTWLFEADERSKQLQPLLDLPSRKDTGYPGMVVGRDRIRISYYSSHCNSDAERTDIFVCDVQVVDDP